MTAPAATPEALVAALELLAKSDGNEAVRDISRDALSEIRRLASSLQRVTAERDEAREVVARCNNSFGSYSYHLDPHPAEQIEKVKWQARSEWQRAEAATAEAASLRAEVEAKDRALKDLRADAAELAGVLCYVSAHDDPKALRDLCWKAGHFLENRIVGIEPTAPASAATAREGASR